MIVRTRFNCVFGSFAKDRQGEAAAGEKIQIKSLTGACFDVNLMKTKPIKINLRLKLKEKKMAQSYFSQDYSYVYYYGRICL